MSEVVVEHQPNPHREIALFLLASLSLAWWEVIAPAGVGATAGRRPPRPVPTATAAPQVPSRLATRLAALACPPALCRWRPCTPTGSWTYKTPTRKRSRPGTSQAWSMNSLKAAATWVAHGAGRRLGSPPRQWCICRESAHGACLL